MELVEEYVQIEKTTVGVFIDLKIAFDTIDHNLLFQKLQSYGIRGAANDWIRSYLTNRKQFVQVDGHSSDYMDVVCGVPQGSV